VSYWLSLFTGTTWDEFLNYGGTVTGFREGRLSICSKITVGDRLLCYVTGLSRFVGVLQVESEMFESREPIWRGDPFPVRFKVSSLVVVPYDHAVPALELLDRLTVFSSLRNRKSWSCVFRRSPRALPTGDGDVVFRELLMARASSTVRLYDSRKLYGHRL
jgi:hypothetical protein